MTRRSATRASRASEFYVLRGGKFHWFADRTLAEVFFARNPDAIELVDVQTGIDMKRREHDDTETPSGTRREERRQEDLR
jgi:hypothetical protein